MKFDMYRLLERQERGGGFESGDNIQTKTPAATGTSEAGADGFTRDGSPNQAGPSPTSLDQSDPNNFIRFSDYSANGTISDRVFDVAVLRNEQYYMKWDVINSSLKITLAKWNILQGNSTPFIAELSPSLSNTELVSSTDLTQGITLMLSEFRDNEALTVHRAKAMALTLHWTLGEVIGNTTSRAFTVIDSAQGDGTERAEAETNLKDSQYADGQSTEPKTLPSNGDGADSTSRPSVSIPPKPSLSSGAGEVDGGGGGGLSTGAIAGIAVGVGVLALVVLGAVIFFCMRRRRRRQSAEKDSYDQQAKMSYMAAGKEASGNTADSPMSPYRDDQFPPQQQQQPQQQHYVPPRVPVPATAAERSNSWGTDGANATSPTPGSGAATPQNGVSRHLVEEGMSPDEIRRLEEEERQLDDEIQRAGRR